MSKILVTGASGDIGRKTLLHLLKKKPKDQLVGLARDPAKAKDLSDLGIEVRQGNYDEPTSLSRAFAGIEKVMLTSAHAFTDRKTAQGNVIDAAVGAGVKYLVYMSIARKKGSDFTMKEITEDDIFTERKLLSSGLAHTLVFHPPFLDVLGFYIGFKAHESGVRVPAGTGKFAAASRDDLAAAHASILAGNGQHENKVYTLTGDPAISFADIAEILSRIQGKEVPYVALSDKEYLDLLTSTAGIPDFIAEFALKWVQGMNAGEWQEQTKDLETLIGHKPKTAAEFFRDDYLKSAEKLTTIKN